MQPILGLSQVLLYEKKDSESLHKFLRIINRNAERLRQLIEDLLDVTRIESQSLYLEKERLNLNSLINDAISESEIQIERQDSNKRIIFNAKDDININGDKGRISQVVSNLLSNAVKFTEAGDSITVSTETKVGDELAVVSVKDTGIGIKSEILPRLFTKFVSKSERGGTGVGLYISKSIINAHGGEIWAENNSDGKGANFIFSLPLAVSEH